jgi:ribosomal protein S24E
MISYKDKSTWLAVVWDTIHQLEVVENEYCIKQNASGAARWDDVCTAKQRP